MQAGRVEAVRRFNRFWTRQIGLLQAGLLDTPYSLAEARVIFELAQVEATDLADLRTRLALDAGYLSRIVSRLRSDGIIHTEASAVDARRQVVCLTEQGRAVFADLNERSASQVSKMLGPLNDEDQRRLVAAMATIQDVIDLRTELPPYVIRPLQPGDIGWVVHRHGVLYNDEYAWDQSFEALVARVVADYVQQLEPRRANAWIAEVDGDPAGSVFCCYKDDTTAQLRLLLVEPRARGLGIGSRLVHECIRFARRAGYTQLMLWTNDVLVSARRIYEAAGFRLTEEERHNSFGHGLVGQNWVLDLNPSKQLTGHPEA